MTNYVFSDRGDLRKYRTEIPNLIDDLGLSVFAYRLYGHIKRVAGEQGDCYQSTATLAKACGMSAGKVSQAKDELLSFNLIEVAEEFLPRGGRALHHIAIVDIWLENFIKYTGRTSFEEPESEASSPHELDSIATSPHEQPSSPHEQATSPHEIKNKHLTRINTNKKEHSTNDEASSCDELASKKKRSSSKKAKTGAQASERANVFPIAQALATVTGMDLSKNSYIFTEAKRYYTPDDVARILADYSPGGAWYLNDWRGKKKQRPTLKQIRETWHNLGTAIAPTATSQKQDDDDEAKREQVRARIRAAREKHNQNVQTGATA